jgi:hypothetical protein
MAEIETIPELSLSLGSYILVHKPLHLILFLDRVGFI